MGVLHTITKSNVQWPKAMLSCFRMHEYSHHVHSYAIAHHVSDLRQSQIGCVVDVHLTGHPCCCIWMVLILSPLNSLFRSLVGCNRCLIRDTFQPKGVLENISIAIIHHIKARHLFLCLTNSVAHMLSLSLSSLSLSLSLLTCSLSFTLTLP